MKKNLTLAVAIMSLLLLGVQKTNAQSWLLGGNSVTKDTTLGTVNNYDLNLITNNAVRMRITQNGRVAIGTTITGKAKFSLGGSVSNTTAIFGNDARGVATIIDNPAIAFNNYYNSGWKAIGAGYGGWVGIDYASGAMQFATSTYGIKDADVTPSVKMVMTNAGYVGIGTTSPSSLLHVAGNETLAGNLTFTAGTQSIQFANPGTTPAPMMYMFSSGTTNTTRMVIAHSPSFPTWGLQYTDNGDQFDFLGAGTSRMSINLSNGNVGIGVASPVYKLEVCGTIRAKEVRVETGWCDYVFENNYKLRTIAELEQYINDNKHLPGIAPASDVEKNGLKVAEMNKAMMEKIEELTLYVIQLSKQNEKLQSEIDALKK